MKKYEVIWAAGVIDATSAILAVPRHGGKKYPRLTVTSRNLEIIEKLHDQLGQGKVRGPYRGSYMYVVESIGDFSGVYQLLRPHVCNRRLEQFGKVFEACEIVAPR